MEDKKREHDFCTFTGYCKHCGNHKEMVLFHNYLCVTGDNVIAISHLRQKQIEIEKLKHLLGA